SLPRSRYGVISKLAEAGPAISGCPPGAAALPPNSTGICPEEPGSVLLAGVIAGEFVPNQLPLKFFTFVVPGAGQNEIALRSTIWPYQLPLRLLFENVLLSDCCTGVFDAPFVPSRNKTPTVQLLLMSFSATVRLSV